MPGTRISILVVLSIAVPALAIGSYGIVRALRRRLVVVDVHGASMEPTLRQGDRVLVSRIPADAVRAGDIVVIERGSVLSDERTSPADRPDRRRDWAIKRAAAVAGDPVPASVAAAAGVVPGATVPAGFLVVLGDNPVRSADSRVWGYLPAERLLGVVRRRLGSR